LKLSRLAIGSAPDFVRRKEVGALIDKFPWPGYTN